MRTLLIAIVVLLVAAGGWWVLRGRPAPDAAFTPAPGFTESSDAVPITGPLKQAREAPAGQKEYRNERYRFALFYPESLTVQSFDEGGGATTITFQNVDTAEGFQIFVVPYTPPQISQERFLQDAPSGVMRGPKDVSIDGVAATTFYSTDLTLGDTAEIWFLRGGYLYEVTTLKPLAGWLSQIMASWEFI